MNLNELAQKTMICYDGGFGTELIKRGMGPGELSERWNISHPDDVTAIHKSYLDAGADIILTNTFGAHSYHFEPDEQEAVIRAAVANAKRAIEESGKKAYIALDIGSCGHMIYPMGDLMFEDAVSMFGRMVRIGADAGVDMIQIETMNDFYELKAAVLAAKENCDLPVAATAVMDQSGHMLTGSSPEEALVLLEGLGADLVGINCGVGPDLAVHMVRQMARISDVPLMAKPNAGLPRLESDNTTSFDVTPEEFTADMSQIMQIPGVAAVGGCCGTSPEYIRQMDRESRAFTPQKPAGYQAPLLATFNQFLDLRRTPAVIGTQISPSALTGLADELSDGDYDSIQDAIDTQMDDGAQILDLNLTVLDIDLPRIIKDVIVEMQGMYAVPFQIHTDDSKVLEAALRIYNGKAMFYALDASDASLDAFLPVIKKYGAVVVARPQDERGIPENALGRMVLAEKIYQAAARYGVPKRDIVIDVLADGTHDQTALDLVAAIHRDGGFSLMEMPEDDANAQEFLEEALDLGLNAVMMDPGRQKLMQVFEKNE